MKAYLLTTGAVFGLLTLVHVWRMIVEASSTRDPWVLLVTVISAVLAGWAFRLARVPAQGSR